MGAASPTVPTLTRSLFKITNFYTHSQVVNVNNNVNNNNNNLNGINANTNVQDSNNANANNNAANVILGSFINEFMKLYFTGGEQKNGPHTL